jgi:uncharacterized protein (DUF1800 family)
LPLSHDTQESGMVQQVEVSPPAPAAAPRGQTVTTATTAGALALAASLAACGGGSASGSAPGDGSTGGAGTGAAGPTTAEASRFLAQASMGADRAQIARVQTLGYAGWLDEQFNLAPSATRVSWLVGKGYDAVGVNNTFKNSFTGFDPSHWRKLLASPDTLRQRMTMALSEIVVVSLLGLSGGWRQFAGAAYLDLLEAHAFGNYRTLLQAISTHPTMGQYLTFLGNVKANTTTGALPDENYARELMQLFSIGLLQLNLDGTPKLVDGKTQETYTLDDITGLARVFTGWDYDTSGSGTATPDYRTRPMVQVASRHETGASTFLGSTVPSGLDGAAALTAALDIVFAHPNVAPFVSRQLIQRLVTSNPSPAYVQRVATAFLNDGSGTPGNLKAVLKAILLDDEARNVANLTATNFGKLREPVLRLAAWARAFGASSPSDAWAVGDTSDPATRLGQSPLRSPTVFNFFRPGYVPPNSAIGTAALVAPEFQITNESSVVGYVNYMQTAVSTGLGDLKGDYTALQALADDARALLDELNLVLAANQLSAATLALIKPALDAMPSGTTATRSNRIYAALVMVLAAPEFLVQK